MEKTQGKISAVSQKEGKYGICVDGDWYNGFGNAPAKKGDEVEIEFEVKGNFRNPGRISVIKPSSTTTEIRSDVNASQLTSYAKDLAIAMIGKADPKELKGFQETMQIATQDIIQAYKEIKSSL